MTYAGSAYGAAPYAGAASEGTPSGTGTYALNWSPTRVGKGVVYQLGMLLDVVDLPAGANGAIRFPYGMPDNANFLGITIPLTIVAGGGTVKFQRKTSSESGFDFLRFYIDGVQQGGWAGDTPWGEVSFPITAGEHTLTWRYTKDGSAAGGADTAWVALLEVTNVESPPDNTTTSLSRTTVDFEDGAIPADITPGQWSVSTSSPISGTKSLRSPATTSPSSVYTASLSVLSLPEPSVVSFNWKRSGEGGSDPFYARAGGVIIKPATSNSEESGTTHAVIPSGAATTVEWTYSKDGSVNLGQDAAWVDDVSFPNPAPPPDAEVSGTMAGAGDFSATSEIPPPPVEVTGTLSGTGNFTAVSEIPPVVTYAEVTGTLQGTGNFTATRAIIPVVSGTVTGSGNFTATAEHIWTVSGTVVGGPGVFTAESVVVRHVIILPPKIGTFLLRTEVPVVPIPELEVGGPVLVAHAFGPVTMNGAQASYSVSEVTVPAPRQRITADGVDISYFRGAITPNVSYTLLEPLLYGPASLDLPQVVACFERLGQGELSWLRPGSLVEVQYVLDNVVVDTAWKGVMLAFDTSGATLSVELGGEVTGRAAIRNRQVPIFPHYNDIGKQIANSITDLGMAHSPKLGTVTGIEAMTTGGTGHLEHLQNLVTRAWTRGGRQWTVMPDEDTGVYRTFLKDVTTVHATVFTDDARTTANLRRDIAEEPNRIYGSGVTPQGQRVRNGVYPGLFQGPPPQFPGHMEMGDRGEGPQLLIGRLHAMGYLKLMQVTGGYDQDVYNAVIDLQKDAGIARTGEVNRKTWDALYDLDITGTSLEWAHIEPMAQRSKVKKWNLSGTGTRIGKNPDFDPSELPRDRNIDFGTGLNRSQMRDFARNELFDSDDPNWIGDISFNMGALLRGQKTTGHVVTEADVMPATELRPGMNVWLPQFDGGTLVHVAACSIDAGGGVSATVDTRFRDAMEAWEVIARNKESRNDPGRHRNQRQRASTIVKDSIGEWDEVGGLLGHKVSLENGWTIFEVVAAMEGTIAKLKLHLDKPAEFACAVFGKRIGAKRLNELVPSPLTKAGSRAWELKQDSLDEHWLLYSAGTQEEPCGYSPGRKKYEEVTDEIDGSNVTTPELLSPLTGKHIDSGGFAYRSDDRTKLYVAVWVKNNNTVKEGRIMWPQLEASV